MTTTSIKSSARLSLKRSTKSLSDLNLSNQIADCLYLFDLHKNIRTSFYKGYLLNGVQLNPIEAKGLYDYQRTLEILDNGSILYRCGVYIFEYNSKLNTYRPFAEAPNAVNLSVFRQSLLGRTLVGILSKNSKDEYSVDVYEYYNREKIYSDTIRILAGWNVINFFVNFGRKKIVWLTLTKQGQCKIVVCHVEQQFHVQQRLDFLIQSIHYNSELAVYIASYKNSLYLLTHEEMSGFGSNSQSQINQVFYTKKIYQCSEDIKLCCTSNEYILVASNKSLYFLSHHKRHLIKKVNIEELLGDLANFNSTTISCIEFVKSTIVIGFERLSVLCCLDLVNESIWKKKLVKFSSSNFLKFSRLLMDPEGYFVFTISIHNDCFETEGVFDDLQLGQPKITLSNSNTRRQIVRLGELQLKMLNQQNAFKTHPMQTLDYINLLSGPWTNEFYYHTSTRIQCSQWNQPVPNGMCSAIHPACFYVAVGFRDSFRVYAITVTGLIPTNLGDAVKECRAITYSSYGNHLAVSSLNLVQIYCSYTCKKTHVITHTQSSIIKSLKYCGDQLHCVTRNNTISVYSASRNYAKEIEFHPKEFVSSPLKEYSFDIIEYDPEYDVFIAVSQHQIMFFTNRGKTQYCSHTMPFKITALELCPQLKVIFLGTDQGSIMSFTWPNNPNQIQLQYPHRKLHSTPVILIRVNNTLTTVTSISTRGSIFVSQLRVVECLRQIPSSQIQYENRSRICVNDLLLSKKLSFFSFTSKAAIDTQTKQIEEKVLNRNFMEPEQQQKQKSHLTCKVKVSKSRLNVRHSEAMTYTNNTLNDLKDKILIFKQQIENMEERHHCDKERIVEGTKSKMTDLSAKRASLESNYLNLEKQYAKEILQTKKTMEVEIHNFLKEKGNLHKILQARVENQQNKIEQMKYDCHIKLSRQELQTIKQKQLQKFIVEINNLTQANSAVANANYHIEKDIALLEKKHLDLNECTQLLQQYFKKFKPSSYEPSSDDQFGYNQQILNIELDSVNYIHHILQEIRQIQMLQVSFREMKNLLDTLDDNIGVLNGKIKEVMKIMANEKQQSIHLNNVIASRVRELKRLKSKLLKKRKSQRGFGGFANQSKQYCQTEYPNEVLQKKKTQVYRFLDSYNRICHTLENDCTIYSKTLRKTSQQKEDLIEYLNSLKKEHVQLQDEICASKIDIKQQFRQFQSLSDRRSCEPQRKKTNFQKYIEERKFKSKRKFGRSDNVKERTPKIHIAALKN